MTRCRLSVVGGVVVSTIRSVLQSVASQTAGESSYEVGNKGDGEEGGHARDDERAPHRPTAPRYKRPQDARRYSDSNAVVA